MQYPNLLNPLLIIVGPTAVGKTELSIRLAQILDSEIISADSRLVYRGMDIGTAKPSLIERSLVPHHLIDICDPDEEWSLAIFQREVKKIIQEIRRRKRLPMLVGGTGQFIHAIIEGWELPAQKPNKKVRAILEAMAYEVGTKELHRRLNQIDPPAAEKIEPGNLRRVVRALEVMLLTGYRFSSQTKRNISPYSYLIIGLNRPRQELYDIIDRRIESMLMDGFIEEVRNLLERGYSPTLPSFSAIGYRELIEHLQGKITLEEAVVKMKRFTRQFVRRQANWFKPNDPHIHWFEMDPYPLSAICSTIMDPTQWFNISGAIDRNKIILAKE